VRWGCRKNLLNACFLLVVWPSSLPSIWHLLGMSPQLLRSSSSRANPFMACAASRLLYNLRSWAELAAVAAWLLSS
jgi:hypothetical protein